MIRIDAARLSNPYDAKFGAQNAWNEKTENTLDISERAVKRDFLNPQLTSPPTSRLYELIVGHNIGMTSGKPSNTPAKNHSAV
jgi:hypothetical protein